MNARPCRKCKSQNLTARKNEAGYVNIHCDHCDNTPQDRDTPDPISTWNKWQTKILVDQCCTPEPVERNKKRRIKKWQE